MAEQEVHSPEKERQILEGAAAAFARDGYEGTSMSIIAATAGVSKGTLYNYFAGKKELFAAFVQRECAQSLSVIFDDVDEDAPLAATLYQTGRRLVDMLTTESAILMFRMVVAEARKFPELAALFDAAGPQRALVRMAALIGHHAARGRISIEDPTFAASQLLSLMQPRALMQRRMGLIDAVPEAEKDRTVREAVRLFLAGHGAASDS